MTRGLKSPCLAPFPFKILLASQASGPDGRRPPSSICRKENKGGNLLLFPGDKGQLCFLKLACSHEGVSSWRGMFSPAFAYQADTSTQPIHQLLAQQLARLVTSFSAQEVTSLAYRADTKAHFYLNHCISLQVCFPTFHANISTCGYLCSQESDCL